MHGTNLHISSIARLPPETRRKLLAQLTDEEAAQLIHSWPFQARPDQLAPDGYWLVWLILAGRGWGKSRTGAEWTREQVKAGLGRLHLIAPTASDARDVMVEGESGLLSVCWEHDRTHAGVLMGRPTYEPSKRRVTWANGAIATLFSAEEPERLRGPQCDSLWADELAAWKNMREAWNMAMFGLRLGTRPQTCITTTPKPLALIRELRDDPTTHVTRGSTFDNAANLAPSALERLKRDYEGTRLGRQELHAELLEEAEGALWSREMIEAARLQGPLPEMKRIVVAIDPAVTNKAESNLTGIVAAGLGHDDKGYILADASGRYSPDGWADKAIAQFKSLGADRFVAEGNQGGDLVRYTIQSRWQNAPVKIVHAARGKQARAEPVAALYEQGRVKHAAPFTELEDQLCVHWASPIAVLGGEKIAAEIRKGDLVWTRSGLRPVLWSGCTGLRQTMVLTSSSGHQLRVTANHPIYVVGQGFKRCDQLAVGDKIIECHTPLSDRIKHSRANDTSSKTTGTSGPAGRAAGGSFIAMFGKTLTARFRLAARYTTSTAIRLTTCWRTWLSSAAANTSTYTGLVVPSPSMAPSAVPSERPSGRAENPLNANARNAGRSFYQRVSARNSAADPVVAVSTVAAIKASDPDVVWDISVDRDREFFASGILVHNCTWEPLSGDASPDRLDAMVWAVTELMLDQTEPFEWYVSGQTFT